MAYLIIDDGHPESDEYSNNYIYFDEADPQGFQKAFQRFKSQKKSYENNCCKDHLCKLEASAEHYCATC